jgi:hypothetical protein
LSFSVAGQAKTNNWRYLRDSLDRKLDLSDFIIDAHGFVPVPFIITEPAVGGFGGGLCAVFLKRRPPLIDTIREVRKVKLTPPDITGGVGMATLNGSWAAMGFRSGAWLRARSKYRVAAGYADIDLSFFRENDDNEEREFKFNFETIPVFASLLKHIGSTAFSAGISYLYLDTKLRLLSEELPEFLRDKEWDSMISMPALVMEADTRDNIFTPDKGILSYTSIGFSDAVFGSDYDYMKLNTFIHYYASFSANVVLGLRYELSEVFNDPPFYVIPYMKLRGVPAARYQGNIASVTEAEVRWDFIPRWSTIGFAGAGKVHDAWSEFKESDWISSAGAGVRYLVARKFGLRMGVDIARGPDQWAYYVVFGNAWLR